MRSTEGRHRRRLIGAVVGVGLLGAALSACGSSSGNDASVDSIPFTRARVVQTASAFDVSWAASGSGGVTVYAGEKADAVGTTRKVGSGDETGTLHVTGLPAAPRWYFELVPDKGHSLVLADRSLHLASAPNFRDVGGYRTSDGHWVKMGLLYRSDALDKLSDADYATLQALDVQLVCDLRTEYERSRGQDRLPPGVETISLDVAADGADQTKLLTDAITSRDIAKQQELLGGGKAAQILVDGGRAFVTMSSAKTAYTDMLDRLADPSSYPTLMHCSAGKDRTGWAAAILLTALGVPRSTVEADYLLSNHYLKAKNDSTLSAVKSLIDPALLEPLLGVRRAYIAASFDQVDTSYGSFDAYLAKGLAVDDAQLRALRKELLAG